MVLILYLSEQNVAWTPGWEVPWVILNEAMLQKPSSGVSDRLGSVRVIAKSLSALDNPLGCLVRRTEPGPVLLTVSRSLGRDLMILMQLVSSSEF